MSWGQRKGLLIWLNRVHVGFIVLIVLNFLLSLSSTVDGKPSRNDDDDHGTYTGAHLSTEQGSNLFDDDNKSASPVSVPFVIPSSYNKLRVPKFRNRKPVVPFSTVRKLNDDPKRKPYTTPVPVGQGFAAPIPPMDDSKRKWGLEFNGTSNTTTTLPPFDYNTELETDNGTGAGAFGKNTFKTVLEQEEDRISFNENRDISKSNLVAVRIIIQNIREIDEIDEELTVDMDIILSWIDWDIFQANKDNAGEGDHKLIPTESLDPNTLQKIWKPDIFIENAVSIKKPKLISEPVKLLYSGSDGRFIYITRATVKTSCQMEFQYYPSDTQHCQVKIRSYAHSTEEITLNWDDTLGGVFIIDRDDNNFDVRISSVEQAKSIDAEDVAHLNFTNQYHLLEYTISARRKLSFHIIQTYLPSFFFVLITWLCFLIPSDLFEARVGMTMTTLLTLTSMFSSVRENTPTTSYGLPFKLTRFYTFFYPKF